MSKLGIPVTLTSAVNKPVVETSDIHDVSLNKNQNAINEDTSRAIGDINSLIVGEDNLVGAVNANANAIVNLDDTKANKVDVQTALDLKADKTDLNTYVNDASYDSNTKRINFKHNSTVLAYIDATDFIKDGMVSNVTIENGYLVITFNTDSGQEPIRIALTDIFNPNNYYTKTAIDTKLGTLEFIVPGSNNVTDAINNAVRNINTAIGDLEEEKADKTAITNLQNTKADKSALPNDVGRTATDVGFAHAEGGNVEYLFWLRQADSTKAGAMTAADKVKLDALPNNASLTTLLNNKQNKYLVESTTVPLIGCGLFPNNSNILEPSGGNYQLITPIVLHKGDKVTIVFPNIGAQIYFSTSAFVEGLEVTRKVNYTTPGTYTYTADEDGYYGFATVGTITSIIKEGITVEDKLDTLTPYEEILYADLVTKRNSGTLNPGTWYRITDYITTTTQSDTQSANHPFDILVLATGTNTLSEDALAIQHEGDTYFTNSNLSAWELKYTLNNDTNKYDWADTANGKGVIYYMKDEWNNECPYDFKNIQFRWSEAKSTSGIAANTWYYTFSNNISGVVIDHSISSICQSNKIERYGIYDKAIMNFIVFNNTTSSIIKDNVFNSNCHYNTFGDNCCDNIFSADCYSNTFGSYCKGNTFGYNCNGNTFGNDCSDNIFGNKCSDNTFGSISSSNTFGNNCLKNTSGTSFFGNTFGNSCQFNIFVNYCLNNIFGNNCSDNVFNNNCSNNTFVNSSRNNELKDLSWNNYFDDVHDTVIAGSRLHIGRVTDEKLEINVISEAISGNSIIIPLLLSEGEEQNFSVVEAYDSDWPSPTFHNLVTTSIRQSTGGMLQVYFNTSPQGPIYIKLVYSKGGCCGGCCGSC